MGKGEERSTQINGASRHLVHTKASGGEERAEKEIVQARLNRIERGGAKMAEVSKPDIARAAMLGELKEPGEAFKSGNIGDICDEVGDVLHCSIYLHAAAVEHEETTARWITVLLRVQRREWSYDLERWSKEMRLVRYCSIHLGPDTAKQEANGAANHAAVRWDTVALGVLQQERN